MDWTNTTMEKFGYPATLLREYEHWVLLLRPAQVTLGSLILAAKGPATAYGALSPDAFAEQHQIIGEVERMLGDWINPDKMNYLMLMMVDPHVHFHIFPRYAGERRNDDLIIQDAGWPGPPDLQSATALNDDQIENLVENLSRTLINHKN